MENTLFPVILKRAALMGALLLMPMLVRAQQPDSKAINDLLLQAKEHVVLAEDDAATLASFTLSKLSWELHARRLNEMKEHTKDLISEVNQLNSLRNEGSSWQQEAIDRINPLLREMAATLSATIDHLNQNQARVHMPPYKEYAMANSEVMREAAKVISDLVDFGEARARADALAKTHSLPVSARADE